MDESAKRDIVVVGASAGGVEALAALVRGFAAGCPAAVFVVLHLPAQAHSLLPDILSRAGPLPAEHAVDEAPVTGGRILVAPPDHHLLLHQGRVRVVRGPRENRQRPAVDPLFRTAARAYGERVIGVILSGMLDDGAAGLRAIHDSGGVTVVQDPTDALFSGMPTAALERVAIDHVLPAREMGAAIAAIMAEPLTGDGSPLSDEELTEADMAELDPGALQRDERPGTSSVFSCPECGGVLWEHDDPTGLRFRCRVGHAFSTDTLIADQAQAVESALWMALRSLEEQAALADRVMARVQDQGKNGLVERFAAQAAEARQHAEVVRRLLTSS